VLAGGGADAMLNWMPSALAAREKGLPVVNIAQPFKSSGLMLTCWKDTGITGPQDFKGKTIGVWFFGNEYPFLSWMSQEGIPTDGGDDGVTVLKQGFNVDPLIQRQADCISTMTYNEYGQVLDAGVSPDELVTFKYEDMGVATLEDGIYVLEENLADPMFKEKMVKFVRASMKGWKYAESNPDEAAEIVLENDASGAQTEKHQKRMMPDTPVVIDTLAARRQKGLKVGRQRRCIGGRDYNQIGPAAQRNKSLAGDGMTLHHPDFKGIVPRAASKDTN